MNIEEAIRTRRSIGKVKSDPVPRELIEQIIEAATWAPNHFRTEPWRFIVMTCEGRRVLGNAYAQIAAPNLSGLTEEEQADRLAKQVELAFRAPVVIAAVCTPAVGHLKAIRSEEFAAASAAVQNLLLSAHANGLGAIWRSSDIMYQPQMKQAFELAEQEELIGLIYVGYPDITPAAGTRTPASDKTTWLE